MFTKKAREDRKRRIDLATKDLHDKLQKFDHPQSADEVRKILNFIDEELSKTLTEKEIKYIKKRPWLFRENKPETLPEANTFYDLAGGPRMATLRIRNLEEKDSDRDTFYWNNLSLRKAYGLGHSDLLIDPYVGTIQFSPNKFGKQNQEKWVENFLKDFWKDGELHDKYELTLSWFEGSLPFALFSPRKLKSRNFKVEVNEWSGTRLITLKDWRKSRPTLSWSIYGALSVFLLLSGALIPLILHFVG